MNENIGRLKSPYVFLIRSSFFLDARSIPAISIYMIHVDGFNHHHARLSIYIERRVFLI